MAPGSQPPWSRSRSLAPPLPPPSQIPPPARARRSPLPTRSPRPPRPPRLIWLPRPRMHRTRLPLPPGSVRRWRPRAPRSSCRFRRAPSRSCPRICNCRKTRGPPSKRSRSTSIQTSRASPAAPPSGCSSISRAACSGCTGAGCTSPKRTSICRARACRSIISRYPKGDWSARACRARCKGGRCSRSPGTRPSTTTSPGSISRAKRISLTYIANSKPSRRGARFPGSTSRPSRSRLISS